MIFSYRFYFAFFQINTSKNMTQNFFKKQRKNDKEIAQKFPLKINENQITNFCG